MSNIIDLTEEALAGYFYEATGSRYHCFAKSIPHALDGIACKVKSYRPESADRPDEFHLEIDLFAQSYTEKDLLDTLMRAIQQLPLKEHHQTVGEKSIFFLHIAPQYSGTWNCATEHSRTIERFHITLEVIILKKYCTL